MQERWGGSVRIKEQGVYVWTLYGKKALTYLSCIARYSIIKHSQIRALFAAASSTIESERLRHIKTLKRLKNVYTN